MFCVGLDIDARTYFCSITYVIGLPTSIKVFSWFASWARQFLSTVVGKFVGMLVMSIVVGGITGLALANSELDLILHDSYFVVAHFHYVLALAATLGSLIVSLILYYLICGGTHCEHPGRVVVGLFMLGSNCVFFPLHGIGLLGAPRRVSDIPDGYVAYSSTTLAGYMGLLMCLVGLVAFLAELGLVLLARRVGWWDLVRVLFCRECWVWGASGTSAASDALLREYCLAHAYLSEYILVVTFAH